MNGAGAAAVGAIAALAWCQPQTPSETPEARADATPAVTAVPEAERGPPIEINLPLYGEGAVPLSSLRGKLVVLDLFIPAEPGWSEAHGQWRALAEANPADVAFVAVAVAATESAAVDVWDAEPPSHLVAWDPQGALALRLGAQALPTVVVLDRQGRVVATGADRAAMRQTVATLLGSSAQRS